MTSLQRAFWPAILILALICIAFIDVAGVIYPKLGKPFANDFTVYWTAARAPSNIVYDVDWITRAQKWIAKSDWPRPFINPPSFLLWIAPFGLLPHWPALLLWIFLSIAAFLAAASRIAPAKAIMLALATPAAIIAVIGGQSVILAGAALIGGISLLKARPVMAGILLGLAATIKPQAVLLVPLGLLASRDYRALSCALAAGLGIGLVSILVHGHRIWIDWLHALPGFLRLITDAGYIENGISLRTLAHDLALSPASALGVHLAGGALGAAAVWRLFRTTEQARIRIVAVVVGGILCSPYAWQYELVAATPALAALFFDREERAVSRISALLLLSGLMPTFGLIAVVVSLIWSSRFPGPRPARASFDTPTPGS